MIIYPLFDDKGNPIGAVSVENDVLTKLVMEGYQLTLGGSWQINFEGKVFKSFIVSSQPAIPKVKGAWITYSYDMNAYPIALYNNELDALRKVEEIGYGHVKFWEFGTDWRDS